MGSNPTLSANYQVPLARDFFESDGMAEGGTPLVKLPWVYAHRRFDKIVWNDFGQPQGWPVARSAEGEAHG